MKPIRWSGEGDRYLGPFTYCRDSREGHFGLVISSGDGDEDPQCRARAHAFGHTLIAALPPVVKPFRKKVSVSTWGEDTIKRLGRDWYWAITERSFGFSYQTGYLQVYKGLQGDDSDTDQTWSCFLPWTEWRFARHSLYDLDGKVFWTEKDQRDWDASRKAQKACPSAKFGFFDFDGEEIEANTLIEEREWHRGVGRFKWLSWFVPAKISRSLKIEFSSEVGPKKGSYKGGTTGHGIEMLPGELHEEAFRRYCVEHKLVFKEPYRLWLKSPNE